MGAYTLGNRKENTITLTLNHKKGKIKTIQGNLSSTSYFLEKMWTACRFTLRSSKVTKKKYLYRIVPDTNYLQNDKTGCCFRCPASVLKAIGDKCPKTVINR